MEQLPFYAFFEDISHKVLVTIIATPIVLFIGFIYRNVLKRVAGNILHNGKIFLWHRIELHDSKNIKQEKDPDIVGIKLGAYWKRTPNSSELTPFCVHCNKPLIILKDVKKKDWSNEIESSYHILKCTGNNCDYLSRGASQEEIDSCKAGNFKIVKD